MSAFDPSSGYVHYTLKLDGHYSSNQLLHFNALFPVKALVQEFFNELEQEIVRKQQFYIDPATHETLNEQFAGKGYLHFSFPTWIQGSYTRRDYAQHVRGKILWRLHHDKIKEPTAWHELNQNSQQKWFIHIEDIFNIATYNFGISEILLLQKTELLSLEFSYDVWSADTSVRGNYVNNQRVFTNLGAGCIYALNNASNDLIHRLDIDNMPAEWSIATALPIKPFKELLKEQQRNQGNTGSATKSNKINNSNNSNNSSHHDYGESVYGGRKKTKAVKVAMASMATKSSKISLAKIDNETFYAMNYNHLIDCPVSIAVHDWLQWEIEGVHHRLAVTNDLNLKWQPKINEFLRVLEHDIYLITGFTQRIFKDNHFPFRDYLFLLHLGQGYGGLEHRNSTALIFSIDRLPWELFSTYCQTTDLIEQEEIREDLKNHDGYQELLGLISHEYFHTWNVKLLKPANLAESEEIHEWQKLPSTSLLWWFEGLTAFYDDWILLRCGLMSQKHYIKQLNQLLKQTIHRQGTSVQTLPEASWNAGTQLYHEETHRSHAFNDFTNYYRQGSLVGFALCCFATAHNSSLDHIMNDLMKYAKNGGIFPENHPQDLRTPLDFLDEITQLPVSSLLKELLTTNFAQWNWILLLEQHDFQIEEIENTSNRWAQEQLRLLPKEENKDVNSIVNFNLTLEKKTKANFDNITNLILDSWVLPFKIAVKDLKVFAVQHYDDGFKSNPLSIGDELVAWEDYRITSVNQWLKLWQQLGQKSGTLSFFRNNVLLHEIITPQKVKSFSEVLSLPDWFCNP